MSTGEGGWSGKGWVLFQRTEEYKRALYLRLSGEHDILKDLGGSIPKRRPRIATPEERLRYRGSQSCPSHIGVMPSP